MFVKVVSRKTLYTCTVFNVVRKWRRRGNDSVSYAVKSRYIYICRYYSLMPETRWIRNSEHIFIIPYDDPRILQHNVVGKLILFFKLILNYYMYIVYSYTFTSHNTDACSVTKLFSVFIHNSIYLSSARRFKQVGWMPFWQIISWFDDTRYILPPGYSVSDYSNKHFAQHYINDFLTLILTKTSNPTVKSL